MLQFCVWALRSERLPDELSEWVPNTPPTLVTGLHSTFLQIVHHLFTHNSKLCVIWNELLILTLEKYAKSVRTNCGRDGYWSGSDKASHLSLLNNESITSLPKQSTYMQRQLIKSSIIFNQRFFKFFRRISVPASVPASWMSLILSPSVMVVVNKIEFYFPLKTVLLHPNCPVVSRTCDVLSSSCAFLRSGTGWH